MYILVGTFLQKKCQQYYPVTIDNTYTPFEGSDFTVVLNTSVPYADFMVRELTVTKVSSNHKVKNYTPNHKVKN